jgi:hypothetical protein
MQLLEGEKMTQEAMKLALEALENSVDLVSNEAREAEKMYANVPTRLARVQGLVAYEVAHEKAITALREALAEQPAHQEPDWKAEYLKSVESGCITLDELREANAELDATNRQVEILTDALAESRREIDALVALARADEREKWRERAAILIRGEREACAKVADEWSKRQDDVGGYISRNIRARSNT